MLSRTAALMRPTSTYGRFVQRLVPEVKGPSAQRFKKVAKLWWATEPQFGRKYSEERALAALKVAKGGPHKAPKAKKIAVKPTKAAAPKKVKQAPKPKTVKATKKAHKPKKVKKVKKVKKDVQPVVPKVEKAKKSKTTKKVPKKLTYEVFRRRVMRAAPADARVRESFLKDIYRATRLIRVDARRVAFARDGVRLVAVIPANKKANTARKAGSSRRKVKKAAAKKH